MINPYISHLSPHFEKAAKHGYFLRRTTGEVYLADAWHGSHPPVGIVDFTNPEATEWYTARLRTLLQQGVAVFKTDFGEGVPADAVAANGMTGTDLHNVYTLLFNDAVAQVTRDVKDTTWSGPAPPTSAGNATPPNGAATANAPSPPWPPPCAADSATDSAASPSGATTPEDSTAPPTPSLRPLGPIRRVLPPRPLPRHHHPRTLAVRPRSRRRRPRSPPPALPLMPYLYSAAAVAARTGTPLMRALCVDYPDDPLAWQAELEYLLGPDLLVAPVCGPEGIRNVYLPPGHWVDYWSGRLHDGGRTVKLHSPLNRFPLFVRLGASSR